MGKRVAREGGESQHTRDALAERTATEHAQDPAHAAALGMQQVLGNRGTQRRLLRARKLEARGGAPLAASFRQRIERAFAAGLPATGVGAQAEGYQAKLAVSQPGDAHELEADRVARDVLARLHGSTSEPPPEVSQTSGGPRLQRAALAGEPSPRSHHHEPGPGDGAQIGGHFRTAVEGAMGVDFSDVRVHTDQTAHRLNAALGARAVTLGSDVYFRGGELDLSSRAGQELVAHELTHVLQQRRPGAGPALQRKVKVGEQVYDSGQWGALLEALGLEDEQISKDHQGRRNDLATMVGRTINTYIFDDETHVRGWLTKATQKPFRVSNAFTERVARAAEITAAGSPQGAEGRAALMAELGGDLELAKEVARAAAGKKLLGDLLHGIGTWGKQDADEASFARVAIQASFGPQVVGFTRAALIRLWDVLDSLPASHINRTVIRTIVDEGRHLPTGYYSGGDQKVAVTYNAAFVNQVKVGTARSAVKFITPEQKDKFGAKNVFDQVVLHEIGHSIDALLHIMERHQSSDLFGGWESYSTVKEAAAAMVRAYRTEVPREKDIDDNVLAEIAEGQCLNKFHHKAFMNRRTKFKDIIDQSKVSRGARQTEETDEQYQARMAALYKDHPVVQAAKQGSAIKLTGLRGGWQFADGDQIALGGRAFHLAYKGSRHAQDDNKDEDSWVSYKLSEREHKVSLYQWRSPGEWFAEVYANFELGTLEDTHPLYEWMKKHIGGEIMVNDDERDEDATSTDVLYSLKKAAAELEAELGATVELAEPNAQSAALET